jgi:hypothetical protein
VSDQMSADRVRPSAVTISSYLLYLAALLQVIYAICQFAVLGTVQRVFEDAFAGTEAESVAGFSAIIAGVLPAVFFVLLAAALAILAVYNNRGRNGSRITTWVLGGLLLCCSGVSLAGSAIGSSFNFGSGSSDPDVPDQAEIQRRLNDELPGWFNPVSLTISVVTLLALLGALILLALPASNAFFRKRPAGWEPPVPGAAYPGYPSYPQSGGEPGYPPTTGSPYQPGEPPLPPPPGATPPGQPPPGGAPPPPPPGGAPPPPPPGGAPPPPPGGAPPPVDR